MSRPERPDSAGSRGRSTRKPIRRQIDAHIETCRIPLVLDGSTQVSNCALNQFRSKRVDPSAGARWWTAALAPIKGEHAVLHAPTNAHLAFGCAERSVLGGVGAQLMADQRHRGP